LIVKKSTTKLDSLHPLDGKRVIAVKVNKSGELLADVILRLLHPHAVHEAVIAPDIHPERAECLSIGLFRLPTFHDSS